MDALDYPLDTLERLSVGYGVYNQESLAVATMSARSRMTAREATLNGAEIDRARTLHQGTGSYSYIGI